MNKFILLSFVLIFFVSNASAKVRIPFGKIDKVEIITSISKSKKNAINQDLDLVRIHQEYNVAWLIPIWVTKEPKLILMKRNSKAYLKLTDQELNFIIHENKLNKEKLLELGFYTRYGGKFILFLIIASILYGFFLKEKPKKISPKNI